MASRRSHAPVRCGGSAACLAAALGLGEGGGWPEAGGDPEGLRTVEAGLPSIMIFRSPPRSRAGQGRHSECWLYSSAKPTLSRSQVPAKMSQSYYRAGI